MGESGDDRGRGGEACGSGLGWRGREACDRERNCLCRSRHQNRNQIEKPEMDHAFSHFALPESWMGGFVRGEGRVGGGSVDFHLERGPSLVLHTICPFPGLPQLTPVSGTRSSSDPVSSRSSTLQAEIFLSLRFRPRISHFLFENPSFSTVPPLVIIRLLRVPNLAGSLAHLTRSNRSSLTSWLNLTATALGETFSGCPKPRAI